MRYERSEQASPDALLAGLRERAEGVDLAAVPQVRVGTCGEIFVGLTVARALVLNPASTRHLLTIVADGQALDLERDPPPAVDLTPRDGYDTHAGDVLVMGRLGRRDANIAVGWVERGPSTHVVVSNNSILTIRPASGMVPAYLMWALRQQPTQQHMRARFQGTGNLSMSCASLAEVLLPMPDRATQERVVDLVGQVERARDASRTLAAITERLAQATERFLIRR